MKKNINKNLVLIDTVTDLDMIDLFSLITLFLVHIFSILNPFTKNRTKKENSNKNIRIGEILENKT